MNKIFNKELLQNKKILYSLVVFITLFFIHQIINNFTIINNIVKIVIDLAIFLAAIVTIIKYYKEDVKNKNRIEIPPSENNKIIEPTSLSTSFVKSTDDLNNLADTSFLETPLFPTYNKHWDYIYSNEIYFDEKMKIELSDSYSFYFIKGKPGAGKSTFLLWTISNILSDDNNQFKQVIFLNPVNFLNDHSWIKNINKFDNTNTILVIDAIWRGLENKDIVVQKMSQLFSIVKGEKEIDDKIVGPFNILITIRDDEFESVLSHSELASIPLSIIKSTDISNDDKKLKSIIEKYIESYEVKYNDKNENTINKLIYKSDSNPFYIRLVFEDIKKTQAVFNEELVDNIPKGYHNYIWRIISKSYLKEDDSTFPFILLLLINSTYKFSSDLFHLIDKIVNKRNKNRELINNFINSFCIYSNHSELNFQLKEYSIDIHFKSAIFEAMKNSTMVDLSFRSSVDRFIEINNSQFNTTKESIELKLETHLKDGLKEITDINYCYDFAKLSPENLEKAINIFVDKRKETKLNNELLEALCNKLYLLCIEHATKARKDYKNDEVQKYYELAFDKLDLKSEKIDLTAYSGYITKHIIYHHKNNSDEFNFWKNKVIELINSALEIDDTDKIIWQTKALFYKEIGMFNEADDAFKKTLEIDPEHIPSINAYALFLKQLAKFEWVRDPKKSKEYFDNAEEQFNLALLKFSELKDVVNNPQYQRIEMQLKNSYANFLQSKTEWYSSYTERIEIDTKVEEVFEEILNKYPEHGHSVNNYAHFLINKAKILPKYRRNFDNLIKAETMLSDFIKNERSKKSLSYYMALHLLGRYLYTIKAAKIKSKPIDFNSAINYLKESGKSFEIKHNSIVLNELGQLYLKQSLGSPDRDNLLELAKDSFKKSIEILKENKHNALHLGKVFLNLAKIYSFQSDTKSSLDCIDKSIIIADKYSCLPFDYYFTLVELANNFFYENDYSMAVIIYNKALAVYNDLHGEDTKLDPSIIYLRLGELSLKTNNYENAVLYFDKTLENCNEAIFFTNIRLSIKKIMKRIQQSRQPELYNKLLSMRLYCSMQAKLIEPENYKNYVDYGIDLNWSKKYSEAAEVFSEAILLLEQKTSDNPSSDLIEQIGRFYFEKGFSFSELGESEKAEEAFQKALILDKSSISYFRYTKYLLNKNKLKEAFNAFENVIRLYDDLSEIKKEKLFESLREVIKDVAYAYEKSMDNINSSHFFKLCADLYYYDHDSKKSEILGTIAQKFRDHGNLKTSRRIFIQSLRKDSANVKNLSQLGKVSFDLGLYLESAQLLHHSLELRNGIEKQEKWFYENDEKLHQKCLSKIKENHSYSAANNFYESIINDSILLEFESNYKEAKNKINEFYDDFRTNVSNDSLTSEVLMLAADSLWGHCEFEKAIKIKESVSQIEKGKLESIVLDAIIWKNLDS
ncbi:MAG: hypothetical protein M0P71_15680 [Melioribacteraceae bacterium]|nr:hypothetical protein [Melioribacteraceae bacterium]